MSGDAGWSAGELDPAGMAEVLGQFPSFIAVYEGKDLCCVFANEAAKAIVDGREFVGLPLRTALPEFVDQGIAALVEGVYESGAPAQAREWRVQMMPPGGTEPVEVFATFDASPWRAPDGSLRGVITTGNLVTDMVQARLAARAEAEESEQRYRRAQADVVALQQTLLPSHLPVLPRTALAAHYLVAATDHAAGGDWFDALRLPDGRLALVVGDVVGHGIEASAAMGQLRAVLRELLHTTPDLGTALARLDAFAAGVPAARAATVCVVLLDQGTGELRYSRMGHPPPLVVDGPDASRYLAPTGSGPLGTSAAVPEVAEDVLAPDELLLLFSDGLVERPGRSTTEGLTELRRLATAALANRVLPAGAPESAVDRVCQQCVEVLTRSGHDDDVTVLAAQLRAVPPAPLHREVGSGAELRALRSELGRWLVDLGADADDVAALQLAVTEAVSNSIEHGYGNRGGTVRVEAELEESGRLRCSVSDRGHWRNPPLDPGYRGRGLAIISAHTDRYSIDRRGDGTVAVLERELHHPAVLASGSARPAPPDDAEPPFSTETTEGDPVRVTVSGAVDITTAERLAATLRGASRAGALPLEVDLTGVTQLASAGVQALHQFIDGCAVGRDGLAIIAPAGSVARSVLELVGLGDRVRPA
ncbi:SpoIIE family protein phosphatase [Petropleomorpha daqingensis]|uniref:Serine phosphatase RsbU (Regulator of sigma subunit)/anti-sigma regulatory factor (Ser/Thr protein kinase)/anti-anti-sigma regulatory factor n=1 Tax=Petropleomorpha daqingensis TaxID=2026353 RepID=A0A853CIF4_9ACTN|nr:serine phosphatase RsbU (regulator of sigma subunit)/anti-sigma regulatory factor (Ser/Thr protein kinase)/anti-anti-sigma regulatory factor [Petropleomorpha daqingensis]